MTARLAGRTVLVTGAGRGIGAALCAGMAGEGAAVVVTDQDEQAAAAVAESIRDDGGRTVHCRLDVTDRSDVRGAIDLAAAEFGRLDVLFNNAGRNTPEKFLDITEDVWNAIMRVNAFGVVIGSQEAARQFIRQGTGGKIVNTASIAGRQGFPEFRTLQREQGRCDLADPGRCPCAGRVRDHRQRVRAGGGAHTVVGQTGQRSGPDRRRRLRLRGHVVGHHPGQACRAG
jgi:NAD(P)-dependent dehydrogenase (short-subunit alcohol dehydrogenase family)